MNQSPRAICGTYQVPPLRPELQAAMDEMDRTGQKFAFAVYRSWDGLAWKVNIKRGNVYASLPGEYSTHRDADIAGAAWLTNVNMDSALD